jgi:hypothetical protein
MKKEVFWDVAPCRYYIDRRFGGRIASIFRVEEKIEETPRAKNQREELYSVSTCSRWFLARGVSSIFSSTLKMEAIRSSETSVNTISSRRHIPEDFFLLSLFECLNFYMNLLLINLNITV